MPLKIEEVQTSARRSHESRQNPEVNWRLEVLALGFISFLVILACYRGVNPRITDFRMFYSAAQMVHQGAAHSLYDLDQQHAYQLRFVGKIGLIFNYPAATLLLYLPGAWFSVRTAYLLWTTVSVAMLVAAAFLLNAALGWSRHPAALYALTLLFVPIWINFMQGQIVLVLVLAYALAFFLLRKGKEFAAGCALGLALVKFHLVLPVIFVLLLRRRWRVLAGFSLFTPGFLAVCIAIAGWGFLIAYPRMLLHLPSLPRTGTNLAAMGNLHGLYVGLLHREPSLLLVIVVYLGLLIWCARRWKDDAAGLALAITITVLISHHLNPHDLSLLVIPLLVLLQRVRLRSWRALPLALWAPPLLLYLLADRYWLLSLAGVALMMALGVQEEGVVRESQL